MNHQRSRHLGVTLVEILVVVGILITLSGLVMAVFPRVKGKAQSASCLSNLQQINVALNLYAQDNSDCLPPSLSKVDKTFSVDFDVLSSGLTAYGGSRDIWLCPADNGDKEPRVSVDPFYETVPFSKTSYGVGVAAYHFPTGEASRNLVGTVQSKPLTMMKEEWPLVFERCWSSDGFATPQSMITGHGKSVNVLYVSGAVKNIPMANWIY